MTRRLLAIGCEMAGLLWRIELLPKAAREFFTQVLGPKLDGHPVFDAKGHPTSEALKLVGEMQTQANIHVDQKIGRQTFNELFAQKYFGVDGAYQSVLHDFASAFYAGTNGVNNETVRADASGVFNHEDPRVASFAKGLEEFKGQIGRDAKIFGRDGALTDAQTARVKELAAGMLPSADSPLSKKDVSAFQEILKITGFRHEGHAVQPNGAIDIPTAQGIMNFALMNRTINPAERRGDQTIVAEAKPTRRVRARPFSIWLSLLFVLGR